MVGFIGTALHVAAWVLAIIFDLVLGTQIDSEQAPGAWTLWVWGYSSLMLGFVALVLVTLVHAFSSDEMKIPEGGAPPFLMTLFISGAQISLILTILGIIASVGGTNSDFLYINNSALTVDETRAGKLHAMRNLMVWAMISKAFIVGFLKNNQSCESCTIAFLPTFTYLDFMLTCTILFSQGPARRTSLRSSSLKHPTPQTPTNTNNKPISPPTSTNALIRPPRPCAAHSERWYGKKGIRGENVRRVPESTGEYRRPKSFAPLRKIIFTPSGTCLA